MEDKRSNLRKHINAARDWLQQADKSIERREDVQGDLKLMLAKAELKNAEKHQNHSGLIKLLSFVTAAAITFGIFFINDSNIATDKSPTTVEINNLPIPDLEKQPVSVSSISPEANTEANKSASEELLEEIPSTNIDKPDTVYPDYYEESQIQQHSESYSIDKSDEFVPEPVRQIEPEPVFENSNINVELPSSTSAEPEFTLEAQAPTQDMQKLMQSAGQILRAE